MQPSNTRLTAMWFSPLNYMIDEPSIVFWDDLTVATNDDYQNHRYDTHFFLEEEGEAVLDMYPGIIADACFDHHCGRWVVSGIAAEPTILDLTDVDATHEDIACELFTGAVMYRIRSCRARPLRLRSRACDGGSYNQRTFYLGNHPQALQLGTTCCDLCGD